MSLHTKNTKRSCLLESMDGEGSIMICGKKNKSRPAHRDLKFSCVLVTNKKTTQGTDVNEENVTFWSYQV